MKIKRLYHDGTFDEAEFTSVEQAKTQNVDPGKILKTLQIIDAVTGVVAGLIKVFKAKKGRNKKSRVLPD